MMVKVKTTNQEIVNSKFIRTLEAINGYVAEAKGDVTINQGYSAQAVLGRMEIIQRAMRADLEMLVASIEVVPSNT
jgi:hypothetical protein